MAALPDIRQLSKEELQKVVAELGEPSFRAKQIYEWIWQKGATSFDCMTNISKSLREKLNQHFSFYAVKEEIVQKSKDGTIKLGMKLHDGRVIEGVMIPDADRATACVSSQVGCSLSCSFCATGLLKRERNLTAAEIYDQILLLHRHAMNFNQGRGLTNIVYMGMGEPLLNYDNVMRSIEKITGPEGLNFSPKRITVSTSGIARGIIRMADEGYRGNLALSLHAATNEKRSKIMDINRSNNLEMLMQALDYFYQKTGNEITFEYILLDGFNDSLEDAEKLIKLCQSFPVFVNVIEFNSVEGIPFKKTSAEKRTAFVDYLRQNRVRVKIRRSRGKDIDAACGQLANKH
ncbi:MAG: 23S rRNA (adenine(2503)-C(2))-methyltransferase RlmN [Chitinophagales bacterium]|nr:23S rRNA (adenine(2503)-C(2))-methyltransferase RlmN [Chitinophagales bacterium]MDW8274709.1 23S rRNA (adenine(2503)-C(2))-methyltransferase RlmN [Chitinophagales bacterium]